MVLASRMSGILTQINQEIEEYYKQSLIVNNIENEDEQLDNFLEEAFNRDLHTWYSIFNPAEITDYIYLLMKDWINTNREELELDEPIVEIDYDELISKYIYFYLKLDYKYINLYPEEVLNEE